MRKDVRMGFGVGSVLLAIIIASVLIIHRNKNSNKAVAFDPGKSAVNSSNDTTASDLVSKTPDTTAEQQPAPQPIARVEPTPITPVVQDPPKAPVEDATDKTGARWDALFATTDDPLKSQLSSTPSKPRSHSSAQNSASKQDMATESVANGQIESGSQPAIAKSAPVTIIAPRHVSSRAEGTTTHKVTPGETFVSISRAAYGDGRYYQAIVDANPKVAPEKLKPGMLIQLPAASQVKKVKSSKTHSVLQVSSGPALASDRKTYTVQSGDNLYKIAKKLYGKGEKCGDIYTLNKLVIGTDSTKLKVGMVLKLPELPTATASR